jgi:hypothetical protein
MSSPGIQFQLRGFGGTSFINGSTPATFGFDGAVLFPLGNHVLIGPTAGFEWINSSIVHSIGSRQPGSTFVDSKTRLNEGKFGVGVEFSLSNLFPQAGNTPNANSTGWRVGIGGGLAIAGSNTTQQSGFCAGTGGSLPPGCNVVSNVREHDTANGLFVEAYVSHPILPHVEVFVGAEYDDVSRSQFARDAVAYAGILIPILPEVPYEPNAAYTTD